MPTDASFSPWLLWTILVLAAGAVVGLLVGVWQSRRSRPAAPPALTFQPVPGAPVVVPAPPGSGRPAKPPAFMPPPAPLAPALGDNQAEQRTFYRRVGNAVLVLLADADDHRRPRNAWVIDRSRHGLRLAAEQELPVGKVYSVRPAQAPPATPWTAVEVRHCTEVDGHWEAGCRFLQPPPVTVLMLFG